ncbi:hypothetical protein, partial [Mycolicibacterium sp.]|uniref:hypothetical protein n=1 Tax=Mycolicibacterium sp. TaxID=2320850 RepID=UPI003D0BBACC
MIPKWKALRRTGCRVPALALAVAAVAAVLVGCTTGAGGAVTSGGSSAEAVQMESMQPVATFHGPAEAFAPAPDKHVMVLVCGNFGLGCVREAAGARAAFESMGWTVDVVDGRLDPTVWYRVVKQA